MRVNSLPVRALGAGTVLLTAAVLFGPVPTAVAAPTWKPVVDLGPGVASPVVATNSRGDAAVAYRTDSGLVIRTHRPGGSWSAPKTVFSGEAHSSDVGIDARGRATIVAAREVGGDKRAVYVRSQTATGWSSPKRISGRTTNNYSVDLAVAPSGATVLAYSESGGLLATSSAAASTPRVRAAYRTAGNRNWSATKVLSRGDDPTEAQAVIDDRGRATVAWRRSSDTSAVLESRTSSSSGAFKPVVRITSGSGRVWTWRLAGNGTGAVAVAWRFVPKTPTGVEYVMTRTRKPGGSFDAPRRLASTKVDAGQFDRVEAAVAANGVVTTAWARSASGLTVYSVEARQRGRTQAWSATRKITTGPAQLLNLTAEATAGNGTALVWAQSEGGGGGVQVSSRVLSARGSVSNPGQVMTNDSSYFNLSSSRAGDVVIGSQTFESRLWVRVLDTAGPVAKLRRPSSRFTSSTKVTGAWSAADAWSAVSSYTVSRRTAKLTGGFQRSKVWTTTSTRSKSFTGTPGTTYCLRVRAKDSVGNSGASSAERCTAVPVDDRGLAASAGWSRVKKAGSYLGTVTQTSAKGRSLSVKVRTKRLALIAAKCASCGVVDVYLGKTRLKRISLKGTSRQRVLIPVKTFGSVRSGKVRIVVVSSGKKVVIDGLATSQR